MNLRRPKEQWGTRIKHSLFLNLAFDCVNRKSATSTFTTLPFESNVLQNHKKLLTALNEQHLNKQFCNLHTNNVILAMYLMFKPFFLITPVTFWQKIIKICSSSQLPLLVKLFHLLIEKTTLSKSKCKFQSKTMFYL